MAAQHAYALCGYTSVPENGHTCINSSGSLVHQSSPPDKNKGLTFLNSRKYKANAERNTNIVDVPKSRLRLPSIRKDLCRRMLSPRSPPAQREKDMEDVVRQKFVDVDLTPTTSPFYGLPKHVRDNQADDVTANAAIQRSMLAYKSTSG